jgi:Fe-S oxidoreductase
MVEFGGETKEESDANAQKMIDALNGSTLVPSMRRFDDKKDEKRIWKIRESSLGATAYVPGKPHAWEGWEDSAVDPKHLGNYLRELRQLMNKYAYIGDLYGHFGQACVHTRNNFDLESAAGIAKFRAYLDEAADLCVKYNGSLSGEHGDGQARAELLPKMFGERLVGAFREFKSIWDPDWKMNPGKVVTPYLATENLRLGSDYHPWSPSTHFRFPEDDGRLDRATLRCVGVGECRRMDGGTMCPSYMATGEEEHSTRGRAHLLFEMFQGKTIPADWDNPPVKEALDLCISCKGCKADCPVNVDMATYKAEFLAHYYERRLRPLAAYTMGWIHRWSRLAAIAPGAANFMMSMSKPILGIAPQRTMPRYARETFVERFRKGVAAGASPAPTLKKVLLWPDTFNNYFHPDTAMAAVDVLQRAGYHVTIPQKPLCCGRPLYDWGFLEAAKSSLREIMTELHAELDQGLPIIGLEPSCVSVFRDELLNLFPGDEDARRLSAAAMTLSEFIQSQGDRFPLPRLRRKALVQGHCHHKAIMKFEPEEAVLRRLGLDFEHPDSGCCGMAGAFGFERKHYEISMRIGERVILPKVRESAPDTLIIANGFSCREQIAQSTNRQTLHLAQVLQMAMREE